MLDIIVSDEIISQQISFVKPIFQKNYTLSVFTNKKMCDIIKIMKKL